MTPNIEYLSVKVKTGVILKTETLELIEAPNVPFIVHTQTLFYCILLLKLQILSMYQHGCCCLLKSITTLSNLANLSVCGYN